MKKVCTSATALILALLTVFASLSFSASAAQPDDGAAVIETGVSALMITVLEPCEEGVRIGWEKIGGIGYYRVERRYDDGRGWVQLTDTSALEYVDTNVSGGNVYQYRLSGVSARGSVLTETVTASIEYAAPPRITSAESTAAGIRLSWTMPEGVAKIALYRRESGWKRIATTTERSFLDTDVTAGGTFTYTIRALNADGSFMYDYFDRTGYSVKRLATPSLSVTSDAGGVSVSWGAVDGAEGYRVFVKSGGSWKRLGDTTSTSFLDGTAVSDNDYTYTVRCISADGSDYTSYFDTSGKSVHYIAAPALKSASADSSGVQISWSAVAGAYRYRVFYKNSSGGWTRMATTSATSYLDKDVRSGSTYTYTVRCVDKNGNYISGFYRDGIRCTYLSTPVISSVSGGADGVVIRWQAVQGAEKYRVYYYGSKGWTRLTDTAETSVTDTDVSSGNTYTYTVRCINSEGTAFMSGFPAGKSTKYVAAPTITGVTNTESGVKLSWSASKGAGLYRVYYYGRSGWTKLADTTATSYLDKNVTSGSTYTYTVRCLSADGSAFVSGFKPGVQHTYISAPDVKLSWEKSSVKLSWDDNGAELYRVYIQTAEGWKRIADTTENSYNDTSVSSGGTYTYTVRCLNADATAFTSAFRAGKSIRFVETPQISSIGMTATGVSLKWNAVEGAVKYRLYTKTASGWKRIADTTATELTDESVSSGVTYTYTVRCINAAGTAFESGFDSTGASLHFIAAPKNIKAEPSGNSIRVSWTKSEGAEKYRVYYKNSKGGWTKFAETTDTYAIDDDVSSGYSYTYTVRCINAAGTAFTSEFDRTGAVCRFTTMPVLKTPEPDKDGVKLSWDAVKGAEKYRVYTYRVKGWTKIADTTATSLTDTSVSSGNTYKYTVRCLTADGKQFTSDFDRTGVSVFYVAAPKLVSMESTARRVTFTWSKPAGASLYRVYKKVGGSWKKQTDTTENSFTDTDVTIGNTYYYTVRCLSADGKKFYSGFDPNGFITTVTSSTENFCYYDQGAYDYPYGDDTIAYSGCGPTCFAMVASTITGKTITPINAVEWCGNDYYVYNVGTMWSYFYDASARFGISCEAQLGRSEFDKVIAALKKGKYVISAQSAGRFTRGGHFIVLAGLDAEGRIIVFDPNGGNHYVGTAFDSSEITEAGTQYWVFDAK